MRSRAVLAAATLALLMGLVPGCALADDDGPLACRQPPEGNWEVGDRELPNVTGMRPQAAAAAFDRIDLAVSWRYYYDTEPSGRSGYSECWCTAPPDGVVDETHVTESGWVIVFVTRDAPLIGGRPQPEDGWGCHDSA